MPDTEPAPASPSSPSSAELTRILQLARFIALKGQVWAQIPRTEKMKLFGDSEQFAASCRVATEPEMLLARAYLHLQAVGEIGLDRNEALEKALRKIARGPILPLPDPEAHSWRSYGTRAASSLFDCMRIAQEALGSLNEQRRTDGKEEG